MWFCLGGYFSSHSPKLCERSLMLLLSSDSLLFHGAHERSEDSLNRAIPPNFNSGTSTCLQSIQYKFFNYFYCLCSWLNGPDRNWASASVLAGQVVKTLLMLFANNTVPSADLLQLSCISSLTPLAAQWPKLKQGALFKAHSVCSYMLAARFCWSVRW